MTRYLSDLLRRSSKFWERVPLELLNSGVKSLTKNSASVEESPVCNLTIVAGKKNYPGKRPQTVFKGLFM